MAINYKPISSYAAIGNLRTVALIARDGSIDWCCYPKLDDKSVFAAILDKEKGGHFSIQSEGAGWGKQAYIEDSFVVVTKFQAEEGTLQLTDFMPLKDDVEKVASDEENEIHRLLECTHGSVKINLEWYPRFNFAKDTSNIIQKKDCWVALGGKDIMALGGIVDGKIVGTPSNPMLRASFCMNHGDKRVIVNKWAEKTLECNVVKTQDIMRNTVCKWKKVLNEKAFNQEEWIRGFLPQLKRSALTLKLLTQIDTGAIAAAATTSLPEWIGGELNWDYRYAWIRDSALTTQALVMLGHNDDAVRFLEWSEDNHERYFEREKRLHVMYGLHGELDFEEKMLDYLEGYMGSKPVRLGNRAFGQTQHGIFGDVFSIAYELLRREIELSREVMVFLSKVADYACDVWSKPDHGIWEIAESKHYVESKVMVWMALDRALVLAENYGLEGEIEKWQKIQQAIHDSVLKNGYDEDLGSFVQSYGSKYIDAANLRIPLLEFLPIDDRRVQGTINLVMIELMVNGHVYRCNSPVEKPIGNKGSLPREEGAFNLCTFWLIDVLSLSGRVDEARRLFEGISKCVNHVGLYSEEIDPRNGSFLGNFPQAFTHIGLINSAMYLAYAEGKRIPITLIGTKEHRQEVASKKQKRKTEAKNYV